MANLLAQRIEETLRPVIGISVDVESRRVGKDADTIERGDLPAIADNLVGALRLVVGPDMAAAAAVKVRELA